MKNFSKTSGISIQDIVSTAVVAALYVAMTVVFTPLSFGVVQIRFSEMFNYLVLYNKRYIWGVTLGVFLSNFMSPTWTLDVPIGTIATLLVLFFVLWLTKMTKDMRLKFVITGVIFALSMFTVAGQLHFVFKAPFLITWFTVGIGELLSMAIGGLIIYALGKRFDLTR